ncbi:MAG: hypothetical protein KHY26_11770, partial [Faecalibacterium prausnitzii]|nr:hypothetical protein [Faecalibacterium prausnitzii]
SKDTQRYLPSAFDIVTQKQKAMDKTLPIASYTLKLHGKPFSQNGYKNPLYGFPMKSKCVLYTLYSAQCFIGLDCTELILFLR